jgi:pleiotropic regulator 1
MNIQKPIIKPTTAPSLLAMRRGVPLAAATANGASSIVSQPAEAGAGKIVPVAAIASVSVGATQELSLMSSSSLLMALQKKSKAPKMQWRRPWKLHRVIQGHTGWVRSVDVDPSNEWFVTGGTDRLIKIWDLASGMLRVTLTGHTHNVRAVRVHPHMKYLFSAGEDNMVKCWDLEQNKVIRHYHGHLSGVYCLDMHPTEPYLFTGSRDRSVRMWDIRTRNCVHLMGGHTDAVQSVAAQSQAPEVISGSSDQTVRLWDITAGKSYTTLTHHHKGIRAISVFPDSGKFATAAPDCVKVWKSPEGEFERNLDSHGYTILNCSAVRDDGIYVAGSDTGVLHFWDWDSGKIIQKIESPPQPGSLSCENGIFGLRFDMSGQRLITAECDKTIKIYREDETALNPNDE